MHYTFIIFFVGLLLKQCVPCESETTTESDKPRIMVVMLARNKEHTLPYFLTLFTGLTYPKSRLTLFIRSDHNQDKTIDVLQSWLENYSNSYAASNVLLDNSTDSYESEIIPTEWTASRFDYIIRFKEEAFALAVKIKFHYVWFLDVDAFLIDSKTLDFLVSSKKVIVAPMLNSLGTYSNFWCGMSEKYWYMRTDEYLPILERKQKGCFAVPMVHSAVLVDLQLMTSHHLTFDRANLLVDDAPNDDIIVFALSARFASIDMFVCNQEIFGYIPPPVDANQNISFDYMQLNSIKLEILIDHPPLLVSDLMKKFLPEPSVKDRLEFDQIYLINLKRRPERKERMLWSFDELGLEVQDIEAVDGYQLNSSFLEKYGIKQLPGYADPWGQRDITFGEIGCFLSHYSIWKDVVSNRYEQVLVFEDDIRFESFFREKVVHVMHQLQDLALPWDLVYLGRKKLKNSEEPWVDGSDVLVHVDYSYWTLGYLLSLRGAQKLVDGEPLTKMVPVDEYLPIMFDKHPEVAWKQNFSPRDLLAFSVAPLLVYPTRYTGDSGYTSDTEESQTIFGSKGASYVGAESSLDPKNLNIGVELKGYVKEDL